MTFGEKLNEYIELLGCTAKQIAEASNISASTVSRYRSGTSMPDVNSNQLMRLASGIVKLSEERDGISLDVNTVEAEFVNSLINEKFDYEQLRINLNILINSFSINVADLASFLNYDNSHLVRIRNGERRPGDPQGFVNGVARYTVNNYGDMNMKAAAARLMNCEQDSIQANSAYFEALVKWLTSGQSEVKYLASDFLRKIDEFDLNEYIRAIHFDELKLPSVPFQLPTSKKAMNIKDMMNIELDFIKATVLSKSKEHVIMYSDMPLEEMAQDKEFSKKWMFGIAMMIKKGLHLDQIHNIDRSFEEMMYGIEGWIPLYMTGQVSPYYLKNPQNAVFNHFLKVSGSAALWGEAIAEHQKDGMYYLTKQKEEVKYYKTRAQQLLKKAVVLMDIYTEEKSEEFNLLLKEDASQEGNRRCIICAPPVFTASEEFLESFLNKRGIGTDDIKRIKKYAGDQLELTLETLSHSVMKNEITVLSQEEFNEHPPVLSLAGMFYESDLKYTYDEYIQHLNLMYDFSKAHPNYHIVRSYENAFRNIHINIHEGKWAIVSKEKSPTIHFVIKHPKLRNAIENMVVPFSEK